MGNTLDTGIDGNELYEVMRHKDPYEKFQPAINEITQAQSVLTEKEQEFMLGLESKMMMMQPITRQEQILLGKILLAIRNRLHRAT